jgi:hypothetical protein
MRIRRAFAVAALAVVAAAGSVRAQAVELFNGKDLTGWTWVSKDPAVKVEDVWSVEDGVLKCKGKPAPAGYIRTEKDYTNYSLKVRWRFSKPGNSGVLLRVVGEDKVWPKSIECQLQHQNAGDIWNIDKFPMKVAEDRTEGRRTKKANPTNEKPMGEWNEYDITLDGGKLTMKVNGLVQNEATDVEVVPGKIALQSEGAAIEFGQVTLTPLGDDAKRAAAADKPVILEGWHELGDGQWSVDADGVIHGKQVKESKEYGHLVSDGVYKDFKATLKFKCLEGNSGFYFHAEPKGYKIHGIQAEIDAKNHIGGIYESYGRQWVVPPPSAEQVAKFFKPQDWNDMTVEAKGDHIVVTVNGHKVTDTVDEKGKKQGHFALQLHVGDGEVLFKDVKIEGEPVK